jgi:ornithine carbamoyltransferase
MKLLRETKGDLILATNSPCCLNIVLTDQDCNVIAKNSLKKQWKQITAYQLQVKLMMVVPPNIFYNHLCLPVSSHLDTQFNFYNFIRSQQ